MSEALPTPVAVATPVWVRVVFALLIRLLTSKAWGSGQNEGRQ
jgi:hypothetical protein